MKISTKGRYAILILVDIAQHGETQNVSLKDIAARQKLSVKYLEQIATLLCKAGMLRSERGPQGGYRLAEDPSELTIGKILRLTEGSLAPVACLEYDTIPCVRGDICISRDFWDGLYRRICDYIDHYTLEDMLRSSRSGTEADIISKEG